MENTGDSVPGVKQWQWTWRTVARFRKHLLHKIRTNNVIRPTACCVCLIKEYYLGRTKGETSFCPSCFLARHFHPKMESSLNGMASHSGSCLYSEVVVAQLCPTLCSPMDCITPGFPVLYCLPEFTQTHVHWFDDAINHLILCCPLLLPSIFPSIRVFSSESALHNRWPKYWSFSFNISHSNEYSGLFSFRIDWLVLLAVQRTLKSLLQHHSSEASIPGLSALFMVQLSHLYHVALPISPLVTTSLFSMYLWACFFFCYIH